MNKVSEMPPPNFHKPRAGVVNPKINFWLAIFTLLGSLGVYMATQARSLSFWDAGEYVTSSSILGIPHPPGNPFYIMLGRFFVLLGAPLPDAMVVSFISGLFSALAVMFTYLFTVKIATMVENKGGWAYLAGLTAAFYTAFSYTFWMNSVEAEVYAGLAFIINLAVWLTMLWVEQSEDFSHQHLLLMVIYVLFLGVGIHQTTLQIAPAILFICVYPMVIKAGTTGRFWQRGVIYAIGLIALYAIFKPIGANIDIPGLEKYMFLAGTCGLLWWHLRSKVKGWVWLIALGLILVGLSSHLYLWVRSEHRPFMNEGWPHTWDMFMDYVLRRQYGAVSFTVRRAGFIYQLNEQFLNYFRMQFFDTRFLAEWLKMPQQILGLVFGLIVLLLGVGGAVYQHMRNRHAFWYWFSLFFMSSLAMVFVMNLSDKEVRERDYFFVTAYNFWALWMGLGGVAFAKYLWGKKRALGIAAVCLVGVLPAVNLVTQYHEHDRAHELIALDYGLNLINGLEENAIIFTNGDNDTFPLWYAQAVADPNAHENIYPATDVTPTDKTRQIIAQAMEYKKTQLKGIRPDVTVANLSLLNTPWYIKQLRDKEGVEFNRSEEFIDNIELIAWKNGMRHQEDGTIKAYTPDKKNFTRATFNQGDPLMVKDMAVIQIILDNFGKRPIYFAVTVGSNGASGFEDCLVNEGMVDRLVTVDKRRELNLQRAVNNLDNVYQYRSIFDTRVYKDDNMKLLLNNYGLAYLRVSVEFEKQEKYDQAWQYLQKGLAYIDDPKKAEQLKNDFLNRRGRTRQKLDVLLKKLKDNPGDDALLASTVRQLSAMGLENRADSLLMNRTRQNPSEVLLRACQNLAINNNSFGNYQVFFEDLKGKYPANQLVKDYAITLDLRQQVENAVAGEDYKKAGALMKQALDLTPQNTELLKYGALILAQNGDVEAAIQHLEKAFTIDPNDPETIDRTLALGKAMKNPLLIVEMLKRVRTNTNGPEIDKAVAELTPKGGNAASNGNSLPAMQLP